MKIMRFFGIFFSVLALGFFVPEHAFATYDWLFSKSNSTPVQKNLKYHASGVASYYADFFTGRPTANGEVFNPQVLTAASKTLPFHARVLVKDKISGRFVIVRINDRGPYIDGRIIDLSPAAAKQLGIYNTIGITDVDIYLIEEPSLQS